MSFKQHVETHTAAAFRTLIARASEQVRQELDNVRAVLQRHSEALAARVEAPLEPADGERLITLVNDLARAAEDEARAAARAARAEVLDELQSQMQAAQAQAHSEIEAARAAHRSDLEAAAAAKAALTEALEEARTEVHGARAEAQAEIETARADAERARVQGRADVEAARAEAQAEIETARADSERARTQKRADVEAARAEAEAARAEADAFKGRLAQVEVALADLQAQLEAERSATASLSSALAGVRNEADRATSKAEAARYDTRTRILQAIAPVRVTEEQTPIEPLVPPDTAPSAEDLRNACPAIDTATSLREVLNALLDQLAVHFSHAAVFLVKGDRVQGWRGVRSQGSSEDLRSFEVPLTKTSPLTTAVRTGRLVVTGDHLDQNGSSSGEGVRMAVAFPIRIGDSVVAVACADGGQPSGHEPQRTTRTSALSNGERLVERAAARLTTLLATSGVIPGFKAAPSAAPDDARRVVSSPQPERSDDTRAVIGTLPEAVPSQAEEPQELRHTAQEGDLASSAIRLTTGGDHLGDVSRTAGGGEMGPAQGAEATPHARLALSVGEDTRREPAVRGVSRARRAALAVSPLVTVIAIAWQVWASHTGVGRPQAPADGPLRERTALQRVADGAQGAAARVDPAGDGRRLNAPVVPPDVHGLGGEALTLRLMAHRVCWIRATADGQMVREGLLQGDEELVVKAREAILLRIGDAGALSVIVNGRAARSLGSDGQVVALRITRADYENLIAQELPRVSSMSGLVRMPQPVRIPPSGAPATDTSAEGLSEPVPGG